MNFILLSTLLVLFASACSKDDDSTVDLSNINATYVQIAGPTQKTFKKVYTGGVIEESWSHEVYDYFSSSSLPKTMIKIGSHNAGSDWYHYEVYDYLYCSQTIEFEETVKGFLMFEGKGTCHERIERYIKDAFLRTQYIGYSFKGDAELENKYAEELQLIGITQTTDLDESSLNKTLYIAAYSVNNYHGTSDSGADSFMSGDVYYIDIYLGENNTINPIQKLPKVSDWGVELTTTESPSYF